MGGGEGGGGTPLISMQFVTFDLTMISSSVKPASYSRFVLRDKYWSIVIDVFSKLNCNFSASFIVYKLNVPGSHGSTLAEVLLMGTFGLFAPPW